MFLLVGLGNPGAAYSRNRHNIGFMAVDEIVRRHDFSQWRSKYQGDCAEGTIGSERILALKPTTFMNLSGQAVAAAARFHKIPTDRIIVFHDELDLPPGRIRIKKGGGAGGHNGLKSVDAHLGADYWRVRLGIGHPGDKNLVSPYVLGDFPKADHAWLEPLIDGIGRYAPALLAGAHQDYVKDITAGLPKAPKPAPASANGEG